MKKYWQIFWHFRKLQLIKMMEYRGDFFFWAIVSLMWTGFNYFFFGLIFTQGDGVPGWSFDQLMILISFFTMIDALTWSVFYPNMKTYTTQIFDGELSRYLILPIRAEFLILIRESTYHNLFRFFVGLAVLIFFTNKMQLSVGLWEIALVVIIFIAGSILLYSLWFLIATIAFWVERLSNINEIMPGLRSVYQVPVSVFTGITGAVFTYLIPLGLITTLPSEVILGDKNYGLILYLIISAIVAMIMSISFFRLSVRKYSSVGG
jgi:ABC-2 type transport system permease protein